jgi:hypothetical protein
VLALWAVLSSLRVGRSLIPIVVFATALCGPVFVNTIYTWPKITASALGLVALAAIWDDRASPAARTVLASSATALAVLCHGSALFAAIALIPFVLVARRAFMWRHLVLASATIGILYAPWLLYQRLWDPPGNRLLYWHLVGTWIDEPDDRPFVAALWENYRDAGVIGIVMEKLDNIRVLVDPSRYGMNQALSGGSGPLHRFRVAQMAQAAWAPGVLLLAIPFAVHHWRRQRAVRQLLLAAAATAGAYVIVERGNDPSAMAFLYTAPLTLLLLACGGLALAVIVTIPVRWRPAALAVALVSFALPWWWSMGREAAAGGPPGSVDWPTFTVAAGAWVAAAVLVDNAGRHAR